MKRLMFVFVPLSVSALFTLANDKPAAGPANRLAKENSPYLRQHAHNPVDWYPWGPEAFEKAKKENKLIFLSIGYSSCHWCHVMERESFSDASVAKILNDKFVCIKVDREERPDVDDVYMQAINVLGVNGGWPLSMFLMPDGKPIIGGTYWPRDDRVIQGEKVKGFKTILKTVQEIYATQTQHVVEQANKVAEVTQERLEQRLRGKAIVSLDRKLVQEALDAVVEEYDEQYGGFGRASRQFRGPKFPMPCYLMLIQSELRRQPNERLHEILVKTLKQMAQGGICDQLTGGFHRYSTERTWTIPHFEKMLYDNAQLSEVYSRAHMAEANPLYEATIRSTLDFVIREMTSPAGGFYSALDADSEGEEGRFYVWTAKELESALPDKKQLELAKAVFGATKGQNFEEKYSILTRNESLESIAADRKQTVAEVQASLKVIREQLAAVRSKRPRPFLDTKVLTAWNGQMIAGMALGAKAVKEPRYLAAAVKAAEFVLKTMRTPEGRLLRSWMADGSARLNGYLDDYAFLIHGLLTLHETTGEARWLDESKRLAELMMKWHLDDKAGGFYFTSHDHEKLFVRAKDQFDGAQPCGNSVAALDLVRLAKKTGEKKYLDAAKTQFQAFAGLMQAGGSNLSVMMAALNELLELDSSKPKEDKPADKPPAG